MNTTIRNFLYLVLGFLFVNFFFIKIITQGMFFDGITYAAISRNLAENIGTPYALSYLGEKFYEHPPLLFILQNFFFRLLGEAWWVEKIYALLLLLGNLYIFSKIWLLRSQAYTRLSQAQAQNFLPFLLILFLLIRSVFWGSIYNLLDNQMLFFDLLAIFFLSKFALSQKLLLLFGASFAIAAAFYTKGPVGLFPLCFLFWHVLLFERKLRSRFTGYLFLHILLTLALLFLPLLHEGFRASIFQYLDQQVFASLRGQRTESYVGKWRYLNPLGELLQEHLYTLCALVLAYLLIKKAPNKNAALQRESLFFLLIGFSASLPTGLSYKQTAIYLIPSAPYFCLSAAYLIFARLSTHSFVTIKLQKVIPTLKVVLLLNFLLLWLFTGSILRDKSAIELSQFLRKEVKEGTVIQCSSAMVEDWALRAYVNRFGQFLLSVDVNSPYYLIYKNELDTHPNSFQEYEIIFISDAFVVLEKKLFL